MIVATAGHVDHGKTTLIRTLTGTDTDRLDIEKQRGLSIELGFAYWTACDGRRFGFIDVPGHARFLPTMASGIGGIDAALLVIAADDGVMPQTIEHLTVLDFLGVTQGVVAISKTDGVEKNAIERVRADIETLLADTCLVGSAIVAVDSLSGSGFDDLHNALTGLHTKPRKTDTLSRLAIDRSFSLKGVGLVVTGTLLSGQLSVGDAVTVSPAGETARIRGLHVQNEPMETALTGLRCAVNLTGPGIDTSSVKRGMWLVGNGGKSVTARFDATIRLARDAPASGKRDQTVYLHIGAAKTPARLVLLDRKTLQPCDTALVQIITNEPIDAVFDDRFLLRDHAGSRTLAGGRVLTPFGATKGRAKSARLKHLSLRDREETADVVQALLRAPPFIVDLHEIGVERNLSTDAIHRLSETASGTVFTHNSHLHLADTEKWKILAAKVTESLAACHETDPHLAGLTGRALTKRLGPDTPDAALVEALLAHLVQTRRITLANGLYRLPSFSPSLAAEDDRIWHNAKALLEAAGSQAPTVHELAKAMDLPPDLLTGVLNRASSLAFAVHISRNRYLLPETFALFRKTASTLGNDYPDGFAATDFRNRAGIGRNLAIDVLEYMDRQGITQRQGNSRTTRS